MKFRRHHNNQGERQVQRGKTFYQVQAMAKKLGIRFATRKQEHEIEDSL